MSGDTATGTEQGADAASALIDRLRDRGLRIAVAESLTGGLLVAELIRVPGASDVVSGGIVAYATPLKHALLDVDADLLAGSGAVNSAVAEQMAAGARRRCALDGRPADVGIATTGVAGPTPQDGQEVGTVWLGFDIVGRISSERLALDGSRGGIRSETVTRTIRRVTELLGE